MRAERLIGTMAVGLALSGCAAPNTPGAGSGKSYTPVIDLQGADQSRYLDDLSACRNSAGMIDAAREELSGLIGGAIFGAAIGASISPNSRVIGAGANSGAISGGARAGTKARSRQEIVMGNCMASKGYRVLDGTANVAYIQPAPVAPTPYAPPAPPPTVNRSINADAVAPAVASKPSAAVVVGKDSFVAERFAKESGCSRDTLATMIGKGPGYESYSFQCFNGETLVVRCEWGNCRALR